MDLPKEHAARIESHLAAEHRDAPHRTECEAREAALLRHFFEYPLMNQIEELWYHSEPRYIPFSQRLQQLCRVERGKINHPSACNQRQQQIRHLRKYVEERQHPENGVLRSEVCPRKHRIRFAEQIRMREHYALGIGSGSRSVEKGSQIIRLSRNWSEFSVVPREYAVEISCRLWGNGDPRPSIRHNLRGDSRPRLSCRAPPGICQHNADFRTRYRLLRQLKMILITNKKRSSAIIQQLRNMK